MWQAIIDYINDVEKDYILNTIYLFNISGIWEKEGQLFAYFNDIQELNRFKECLKDKNIFLKKVKENIKWNSIWRKFHKPVLMKPFYIVPTFYKGKTPSDFKKIVINPSFAFGTGSHATTKVCIQFLIKYVKKSMKILDLGTGTGILAIIAEKLGGEEIYAVDIDPLAIKEAMKNIKRNRCKKIIVTQRIEEKDNYFDLCVANIILDELLKLKTFFKRILKRNGILILSGILDDQKQEIIDNFKDSFEILNMKIRSDKNFKWIGIVLKRI